MPGPENFLTGEGGRPKRLLQSMREALHHDWARFTGSGVINHNQRGDRRSLGRPAARTAMSFM